MRVTFTESGGWTNVRRRCSVDVATLPREVAARLEASLARLLAVETDHRRGARDAATLVFEVERDGVSRRVSFSEASSPAELRPVLEILRPLCRPVPNAGR